MARDTAASKLTLIKRFAPQSVFHKMVNGLVGFSEPLDSRSSRKPA